MLAVIDLKVSLAYFGGEKNSRCSETALGSCFTMECSGAAIISVMGNIVMRSLKAIRAIAS